MADFLRSFCCFVWVLPASVTAVSLFRCSKLLLASSPKFVHAASSALLNLAFFEFSSCPVKVSCFYPTFLVLENESNVYVSPSINLWMPEPISTELGKYVTAPESISTAYFINTSDQSVCPYVYPPIAASQRIGKTLLRQRIHSQQLKNYWTRLFLCGPCLIKEKSAVSFPQNVLLLGQNTYMFFLI